MQYGNIQMSLSAGGKCEGLWFNLQVNTVVCTAYIRIIVTEIFSLHPRLARQQYNNNT